MAQIPIDGQSVNDRRLHIAVSVDTNPVGIIDVGTKVDFFDTYRPDAVDRSWHKAFFYLGTSCNVEQILSFVERPGWTNIYIRLSRHLGGQISEKSITLCAQPVETTFEVDTDTDATTDEAELMDLPRKIKQQLTSSDKGHTDRSVHWRMGE